AVAAAFTVVAFTVEELPQNLDAAGLDRDLDALHVVTEGGEHRRRGPVGRGGSLQELRRAVDVQLVAQGRALRELAHVLVDLGRDGLDARIDGGLRRGRALAGGVLCVRGC